VFVIEGTKPMEDTNTNVFKNGQEDHFGGKRKDHGAQKISGVQALFGTDGIRRKVGIEPLTPLGIVRMGLSVARYLQNKKDRIGSAPDLADCGSTQESYAFSKRAYQNLCVVVIGRDTRASGPLLQEGLTFGLRSKGIFVVDVGCIPTPGVSFLTHFLQADMGIMVSASHNPAQDNGLKFFDRDGQKMTIAEEKTLEEYFSISDSLEEGYQDFVLALELGIIDGPVLGLVGQNPDRKEKDFGVVHPLLQSVSFFENEYCSFLKKSIGQDFSLQGIDLVLDCAHGAYYRIAPRVLKDLGARVHMIGSDPDGHNINRYSGALFPETLQQTVVKFGAHMGIAFDGDGDRLLVVDGQGHTVDGDQILAFLGTFFHSTGRLKGDGVVGTILSSIGLENYLKDLGLVLHRSSVGDRCVAQMLRATGCNLGGEPSGHLLINDVFPTGDGLLVVLQVLKALLYLQKEAHQVFPIFSVVPRLSWEIPLESCHGFGVDVLEDGYLQNLLHQTQECLGAEGRVVLRLSGTEPMIRLMLETTGRANLEELGNTIVHYVRNRFNRVA
jgi:phosphoglucosamine mutase